MVRVVAKSVKAGTGKIVEIRKVCTKGRGATMVITAKAVHIP